ncbi:MAG: hypothetical protein WCL00_09665, partial [Bacteroidota bacterium]
MNLDLIKIRGLFLIFILFVIRPVSGEGQTFVKFSRDSTKYLTELQQLGENFSKEDQKELGILLERFALKWNSEKFAPSQKQMIYKVSDQMLKRHLRALPDFYDFIYALDVFIDLKRPDHIFNELTSVLLKLSNAKNIRLFTSFLEGAVPLFSENLIYKSASTRWKVMTPEYHISMDSVPVITFSTSDIMGCSGDDSLVIYNTKGRYYPLSTRWVGEGGRVDWRRTGLDPSEAYADLRRYQIFTRFSKYDADSVELHFKRYFPSPLMGRFSDRAQAEITENRMIFPAFDSYEKENVIKDIYKNIDYFGGFALEGNRMIGKGSSKTKARLSFYKDGEELIRVSSSRFEFHSGKINSISAAVVIRYKGDSIFHPGILMKYIDEKKEVAFSKDEEMRAFSPWYDSFHKIEFYSE